MKINFGSVNNSWTLFLDRDGVINRRPVNGYVKIPADFEFLPGVLQAIKIFSEIFQEIIIVTNQQGIGKKLMSEETLKSVNRKMLSEIEKAGGRVDKIYHCPDLASKPNNCRKPGVSMALRAKADFPDINFNKAIMAGDTKSDMEFGRNAGMCTVYINTNEKEMKPDLIDAEFPTLIGFAKTFVAND